MNSHQLAEISERTGAVGREKANKDLGRRLQANISPIRNDLNNQHKRNVSPKSPHRKKNNNDDLPPEPVIVVEVKTQKPTCLKDFAILNKLGDGAYSSVYKVKRLVDG